MATTHPQITIKDETFVLVPLNEYNHLSRYAGAAEDEAEEAWAAKVYDDHMAAKARGEDLAMPREQWVRIKEGESPISVIREFRGMSQKALSEKSGIVQSEISSIEKGKRRGTVDTLKALAKALRAPLDVIAGA